MSLGGGGGRSRNAFEVGAVAPSTAKAWNQRAPSVQCGANPLLLPGAPGDQGLNRGTGRAVMTCLFPLRQKIEKGKLSVFGEWISNR